MKGAVPLKLITPNATVSKEFKLDIQLHFANDAAGELCRTKRSPILSGSMTYHSISAKKYNASKAKSNGMMHKQMQGYLTTR